MPLKTPPICEKCAKTDKLLWQKTENGVICNDCINEKNDKSEPAENNDKPTETSKKDRKRTRAGNSKASTTKGKGRRHIFKRNPIKTPTVTATTTTSDSVFFNGIYMQKGDIVSLMDAKDNLYYAQIRGFITDTYLEKSAFITWLIPSKYSPPPNERFDPSTYLIGPDDDCARKLSTMEFVLHAPDDYYLSRNTPYPRHDDFIWTNISA